MQTKLSNKALILSIVISILAAIASAGGLIVKNLYICMFFATAILFVALLPPVRNPYKK